MKRPRILVCCSDDGVGAEFSALLERTATASVESANDRQFLRHAEDGQTDLVVLVAVHAEASRCLEVAARVRRRQPALPIILVTALGSEPLAVRALRAGVTDYLRLPVSSDELAGSLARCLPAGAPAAGETAVHDGEERMIGESAPICQVRAAVKRIAAADCTVLITGETGTGKELIAQLVHTQSRRRGKPLVSINCAAIPDTLLESEIFGYERGAFTGAAGLREGALELAARGSAFFDEIGDMSLPAQAKILRAIETHEVHRVGGHTRVPLDVRLIAATNQDLEQSVNEGRFRKDLYFRLNVARVHLPPLRERKEDIPLILDHYRKALNRQFAQDVEGFADETMQCMLDYGWPGNVRELRNMLEAVFVGGPSRRIGLAELPAHFGGRRRTPAGPARHERDELLSALSATNWNKSKAAQQLRWSRMTLYRKLAKYRLTCNSDRRECDSA